MWTNEDFINLKKTTTKKNTFGLNQTIETWPFEVKTISSAQAEVGAPFGSKSSHLLQVLWFAMLQVSRSRCRHEAERACQRLLSTHKTGDIVKAIIPTDDSSSSLRQLPLCSSFREKCTCTRAALSNRQGEEVNLVKVGNIFISAGKSDKQLAPDEASFKEQQHHPHQQQQHELTVQEVWLIRMY